MLFYPFTFTGKERDSETGYSYFGARYYDSDLSGLFLSVDQMSDKYPSISPYAYCAWNPIIVVDPEGMDTNYYNLNGNQLFSKKGGDNVNMMVITDKKVDEEAFKEGGYHSFDLATLDISTLDKMYDYSDESGNECYYAVKGDGTSTNWQYGDEKKVSEALFSNDYQYNVHTHTKRDLAKRPSYVTDNTIPSEDKVMVGVGSKFGIILGYTRISKDVGFSGANLTNGGKPEPNSTPSFRYDKAISFYDASGRIGSKNAIRYKDFRNTVKQIKNGK